MRIHKNSYPNSGKLRGMVGKWENFCYGVDKQEHELWLARDGDYYEFFLYKPELGKREDSILGGEEWKGNHWLFRLFSKEEMRGLVGYSVKLRDKQAVKVRVGISIDKVKGIDRKEKSAV